jgi:hypothetical protein
MGFLISCMTMITEFSVTGKWGSPLTAIWKDAVEATGTV